MQFRISTGSGKSCSLNEPERPRGGIVPRIQGIVSACAEANAKRQAANEIVEKRIKAAKRLAVSTG